MTVGGTADRVGGRGGHRQGGAHPEDLIGQGQTVVGREGEITGVGAAETGVIGQGQGVRGHDQTRHRTSVAGDRTSDGIGHGEVGERAHRGQ